MRLGSHAVFNTASGNILLSVEWFQCDKSLEQSLPGGGSLVCLLNKHRLQFNLLKRKREGEMFILLIMCCASFGYNINRK